MEGLVVQIGDDAVEHRHPHGETLACDGLCVAVLLWSAMAAGFLILRTGGTSGRSGPVAWWRGQWIGRRAGWWVMLCVGLPGSQAPDALYWHYGAVPAQMGQFGTVFGRV
jgi:hypothetical protein